MTCWACCNLAKLIADPKTAKLCLFGLRESQLWDWRLIQHFGSSLWASFLKFQRGISLRSFSTNVNFDFYLIWVSDLKLQPNRFEFWSVVRFSWLADIDSLIAKQSIWEISKKLARMKSQQSLTWVSWSGIKGVQDQFRTVMSANS